MQYLKNLLTEMILMRFHTAFLQGQAGFIALDKGYVLFLSILIFFFLLFMHKIISGFALGFLFLSPPFSPI